MHPQLRHSGLQTSYGKNISPLLNLEARDDKRNMGNTWKQSSGKAVSQLKNSWLQNSSSGLYWTAADEFYMLYSLLYIQLEDWGTGTLP